MSGTDDNNPDPSGLDLDDLAHLARLRIANPDLAAATRDQVGRLLDHFAILREADTDGVEPSAYPIAIPHRTRPDVPADALSQDDVLRNAPATRSGCFLVPRVVDA